MDVHLFGTGTLEPEADTASAGLGIDAGSGLLPMDLGRGVLSRMRECGFDPLALDTFLITHLHPDHCCELVSLLFARNYSKRVDPRQRLRLIGPHGLSGLVRQLGEAWRWVRPRSPIEVIELDPAGEGFAAAGMEIVAVPMAHGENEAFGFRVRSARGERIVAYTGDTGPGPGLLELARGVDLLVAECAWSEPLEPAVHLWPHALGRAAAQAGCRRLVVTHLPPEASRQAVLREVAAEFGGQISIGRDRERIRV